jgi:hypothetical protein
LSLAVDQIRLGRRLTFSRQKIRSSTRPRGAAAMNRVLDVLWDGVRAGALALDMHGDMIFS